jgi:hypothetical protein
MAKRTRSRITNFAIVAIILSTLVGSSIWHSVATLDYIQSIFKSGTSNSRKKVEELVSNHNYTIDEEIVFVHLGKTAGSSITCMLQPSMHHSGNGIRDATINIISPLQSRNM